MIDDEAPTPRPFTFDPRRLRRETDLPESASAATGERTSRSGRAGWSADAAFAANAGEQRVWQPVAGPADRVSFFAEQARHRRATWRLSAAAVLAIVLAGLPLSLVVTPIVFLTIILFTKLVGFVVPLPASVPALFRSVVGWIGALAGLVDAIDRGPVPSSLIGPALLGVLMLLLPGILVMAMLWLLLRRLFAGAGVGGLAVGLGAREPHLYDLEERQLVNIVEEMAIAAGLPAPRVMLLDGEVANAAVVGSSAADAVVIVSRRLLDEMDRDETQGVLAHALASIGNGDLGVALSMVTVFRTFGLVNTLLDAPVSQSARATLWRLLAVLGDRSGRDAALRASDAGRLLGSRVSMTDLEDVNLVLGSEEEKRQAPGGLAGLLLKVRVYAMFPIWAAAGMAKTALMVMIFGLAGPLLALMWRTRRFLADATAVQLTRSPDGIARGLEALLSRGGGIRGGAWADHLFVVGGGLRDGGADDDVGGLSWVSFHPSLAKRLKRLRALGASVRAPEPERQGPAQTVLLVLVGAPLAAIVAVLLGVVVVLATGLTVLFMMIPLGIVYWVFEWLY